MKIETDKHGYLYVVKPSGEKLHILVDVPNCQHYGKLILGKENADVREIKRGRWVFDNIIFTDADGVSRSGMRGYKCSECGGFCVGESNYCPNCGADMREENGEHDV